ncbi:MAG: 23S rRNA (uracil(1939)-C(5))-methyltransferase RlmD, partial [Candidatus Sericytochromatia bacterium]|nr:23S rRNA (uracil(1939)-C(5))-methyltransferase RlmD [Candidatus Sericytochromatia bacterium]
MTSLIESLCIGKFITVKIDSLVQGGEGLAKIDNFAIFIPQGIPGDEVEVRIISLKPNYARALIVRIITPSEDRVTPPCPVTDECGGCQWQEIKYEKQLESKEKNLIDNFVRIAGIPAEKLESNHNKIIGMETPFYYRNKSQFPFAKINGQIKGGFYKPRSHDIVEFEKCYIQSEKINSVFRLVRDLLKKYDIPIYDERTRKGFFRHLIVRHSFTTNQILIGFVTANAKFPEIHHIIGDITDAIPETVGIVQNINNDNTNV